MNRSIIVDLLKLIGVFGILWLAFTFIPFSFDGPELEVSIEKEERIGDFIIENLMENDPNFREIHIAEVDSALFVIEKRLIKNIGLTDYDYNIRVVDNPNINAVTLPGGNIFVFRGLIEFCDSPEELAAVLAHEIGHVEKRHVVNKLAKEFGLTILFSILTGGDAMVINEIARTALSTMFDRGQEKEADEFGLELLEKSSISPRAIGIFFRRIDRELGSYNENLELLMTHPHNNARVKASMEYPLPEDFTSTPFQLDWEAVKLSVAGTSVN